MTVMRYDDLALRWKPRNENDQQFLILTAIILVSFLLVGLVLSSIQLPKEVREKKSAVPERIAQFVMEKEKPKPKPKVEQPKPKPEAKPKIKKLPKKKVAKKPLTKTQKKARAKAAQSGLLALSNDLADLMDTSDVSKMVSADIKKSSKTATKAATVNKQLLMADAGKGSGGVDESRYTRVVGKQASLQERTATRVSSSMATAKASSASKAKSRSGHERAEEDITIVFDQNKSKLYSIYNRARRKDPGIKGKIVLEITIEPSGKVSHIKVVSSELNNKSLERRLITRIKLFNFGAEDVERITVTYPIEFLPS